VRDAQSLAALKCGATPAARASPPAALTPFAGQAGIEKVRRFCKSAAASLPSALCGQTLTASLKSAVQPSLVKHACKLFACPSTSVDLMARPLKQSPSSGCGVHAGGRARVGDASR